MRTLSFLTENVHIWHSDCLWDVDNHTLCDIGVKGQGHMYLKSVTARNANTFIFDRGCSYLAQ